MELKNANPNGFHVVINNLKIIFYFFQKILKIELKKGLQSSLGKNLGLERAVSFEPPWCN